MLAVIEWPSNLGLRPSGVEILPAALRRAGLLERLHARHAGIVETDAEYDPERSAETGLLNGPALREATHAVARAVASVISRNEIPIVLAGDCSVVLGGLLGARRDLADRVALLFIDGHVDFYQPEASPTGEVADMDLALATGRGPAILSTFNGQTPLVHDEDVVAVGARDREERDQSGSQDIGETRVTVFDLGSIRQRGVAAIADEALQVLTRRFWCHVDADVLDDEVMPAVDYRQPGGLTPAELTDLLRAAMRTDRMLGLSLAIYNPKLDPAGHGARLLVDILDHAFRSRAVNA